nr:MAG TPA: hypothetical protein [Caudoviricetes sp.]
MTNKEIYSDMLKSIKDRIVRCGECRYSRPLDEYERKVCVLGCVICTNGEISDTEFAMWGDDFCSYGEREVKSGG